MLKQLIAGAIIMGSWAIALFFLRFWRRTKDPLFGYFAAAFLLFGGERLAMVWTAESESRSYVYLIRLMAFLLIVFGIIKKNSANKRPG